MKQANRKRIFTTLSALIFVGVFLCVAGPALAAGSHDAMTGPSSCQTMQVNFIAPTSDGRVFGAFGLVLFTLFIIRTLAPGLKNLAPRTAMAPGPPLGSRWRLFQHIFFDALYRQFSPARHYAVVVEPQTYSA